MFTNPASQSQDWSRHNQTGKGALCWMTVEPSSSSSHIYIHFFSLSLQNIFPASFPLICYRDGHSPNQAETKDDSQHRKRPQSIWITLKQTRQFCMLFKGLRSFAQIREQWGQFDSFAHLFPLVCWAGGEQRVIWSSQSQAFVPIFHTAWLRL